MHIKKISFVLIALSCILAIAATVSANEMTCPAITSDGYFRGSDADYETAHSAGTATATNEGSDTTYIGQLEDGGVWNIYRTFFFFDTSGIPDDAIVYKAYLHFTVKSGSAGVVPAQGGNVPETPLSSHTNHYHISSYEEPLGTEAWAQEIDTATTAITIRMMSRPAGYRGLTINKTDTTTVGLFAAHDIHYDGITPVQTDKVAFGTAEDAGNEPYLEIEHNRPPATPTIVNAPEKEYQNNYVAISVTTTDPDGDDVQYMIDWGDHTTLWSDAHPSGDEVTFRHKYGMVTTQDIKVKARDAAETSERTFYPNRENPTWSPSVTVETTKYLSITPPDGDRSGLDSLDQAITKIHAKFMESDETEGTNALHIWWDLSKAAEIDPNLKVALSVETIEGEDLVGVIPAWEYADERNPYIVDDWYGRYADGSGRWNFVLKATLQNVDEPADADEGNNQQSLRFILGFPMTFEYEMLAIIAIALLIILIIWKRKSIFYKFYTDEKDLPSAAYLKIRNVNKKMRNKINGLRNKKKKWGRTGNKAVGSLQFGLQDIAQGIRENKARARRRSKKSIDELDKLANIAGLHVPVKKPAPNASKREKERYRKAYHDALLKATKVRVPVRRPPSYATKEEKEAYEKAYQQAVMQAMKERESAIGTGIVERLFFPNKRMERITKSFGREKMDAAMTEAEEMGKKEEELLKKQGKEWTRRLRVGEKRPVPLTENDLKKMDTDELEEYINSTNNYLKSTEKQLDSLSNEGTKNRTRLVAERKKYTDIEGTAKHILKDRKKPENLQKAQAISRSVLAGAAAEEVLDRFGIEKPKPELDQHLTDPINKKWTQGKGRTKNRKPILSYEDRYESNALPPEDKKRMREEIPLSAEAEKKKIKAVERRLKKLLSLKNDLNNQLKSEKKYGNLPYADIVDLASIYKKTDDEINDLESLYEDLKDTKKEKDALKKREAEGGRPDLNLVPLSQNSVDKIKRAFQRKSPKQSKKKTKQKKQPVRKKDDFMDDPEIKEAHKKLTTAINNGGFDPIEEALKLYHAKGKVNVVQSNVKKGKNGYLTRTGKTIKIDPSLSPGQKFTTMCHELEHWKKKDFKKDKRKMSKEKIFKIEDKRVEDSFSMARRWLEGIKQGTNQAPIKRNRKAVSFFKKRSNLINKVSEQPVENIGEYIKQLRVDRNKKKELEKLLEKGPKEFPGGFIDQTLIAYRDIKKRLRNEINKLRREGVPENDKLIERYRKQYEKVEEDREKLAEYNNTLEKRKTKIKKWMNYRTPKRKTSRRKNGTAYTIFKRSQQRSKTKKRKKRKKRSQKKNGVEVSWW